MNWSVKWGLKLNPTKCKAVTFSEKRNQIIFDYKMHNTSIERVTSFTDLGLAVNSKLNWTKHIKSIMSKANQRLKLVKRTLEYNTDQSMKLHCYKTLVQPLL